MYRSDGVLLMDIIGTGTNKSFGENDLSNIGNTFEELENKFWNNINELKKLKKNSKKFKELYNESKEILAQVHEINQG